MQSLSRRALLAGSTGLAGSMLVPAIVLAQAPVPAPARAPASGPFHRDPLPYATDALEPHIDAKTMEIHSERHHGAYVANLNTIAKDHPQIAAASIPDVLARLGDVPEAVRIAVRNNLGGHANHMMFWQVMGPGDGAPSGDVAAALDRDLGGLDKLKTDFNAAGTRLFGSGWVFITVDRNGKLAIETRPNQDTPLMDGKRVLMGNDVWEHAYYLQYQNRRPDYLKAWWNVVNWSRVGKRYAAAMAGTLGV